MRSRGFYEDSKAKKQNVGDFLAENYILNLLYLTFVIFIVGVTRALNFLN